MDSSSSGSQSSSSVLSKALNGDIEAQCQLAILLVEEGQIETAGGWFKKAALKGHVESAYRVAMLCLEGDAISRSDAIFWMQKAASSGHTGAQYQMGRLHECGIGVKIDPDIALRWYRQAAQNGNKEARDKLAGLNTFIDQIFTDNRPKQKRSGGIA